MGGVLEVAIRWLVLDSTTDTAVVLLGEPHSARRVLPIVIGPAEAQAIAIGVSLTEVPRPLTHDLLLRTIEAASGHVRRVEVVGIDGGTFLAELELELGDRIVRIDARPSDCIALAVRTGAPIGVDRELFDRLSVEVRDSDEPLDEHEIEQVMTEFRSFLDHAEPEDFSDDPDT